MAHKLALNFPVAFPEDVPMFGAAALRECAEFRIRAAIMIAECGFTHEGIRPLLMDAIALHRAADARQSGDAVRLDANFQQTHETFETAIQDMIAEMETLDARELATVNDAMLSLRRWRRPEATQKAKRAKKAAA